MQKFGLEWVSEITFLYIPQKHEDKNSTNTYSKLAEVTIYVYYNVSMKLKRV